jgi:hypothetical protein
VADKPKRVNEQRYKLLCGCKPLRTHFSNCGLLV